MADTAPETTLALLGTARHALVEARTLNDFRRVMEAASVAASASLRAAKLMQAQGIAEEIVAQASEAAREAGAVRLEAQAKAGEIIGQMRAQGELAGGPGNPQFTGVPGIREALGASSDSGAEHHVKRWEAVAGVPSEVRSAYVRQATDMPTTAGLLRFAAEPRLADNRDTVELAYDDVVRALGTVVKYDPGLIAGHAAATNRKERFRKALARATEWLDSADHVYGR
jgi:hypothetical protein